jgi:HD-GYP domain-containing protein (c-di-GMP phosphodiesterase class II)
MASHTQKLIHAFEALADLGQEIANPGGFNEMVRTSLHVLLGTLAIRRGAVVACVPDSDGLECIALWGLGDGFPIQLTVTAPEREEFPGADFCHVRRNSNSAFSNFLNRHQTELEDHRLELIAPMAGQGKLSGLVVLGGKASQEPFTEDDLEVIRAMVRHIGVGIHTHRLLGQIEQRAEENRRLYEDLRTIYRDTVRAFATAIDIKDKYTQGHSERVGKYSEIIARELGWTEEAVEGMAIAGYLHDIGKLVVERNIINAPYKIDAKQSKELNRHPLAGFEILSPIQHPYTDIPLMAKYHHERLDGKGYPDGLIGDEIPFGARIVTLADSFDAMTTDRPYKTRLSFEGVIQDFRRNTGTQFDSQVVVALCHALLKELTGAVKERRIMKMLGKNYLESDRDIPLLENLIADLDPQTQSAAVGNLAWGPSDSPSDTHSIL